MTTRLLGVHERQAIVTYHPHESDATVHVTYINEHGEAWYHAYDDFYDLDFRRELEDWFVPRSLAAGMADVGPFEALSFAVPRPEPKWTREPSPIDAADIVTQMRDALHLAQRLVTEALPKFNWGASALDANAIQLLNDVPGAIAAALTKAEGRR